MTLFLQAQLFHVPFVLWKCCESNLTKHLCTNIRSPVVKDVKKQKRMVVKYFKESFRLHNWYALKFAGCELMNLVNVVSQMIFIDGMMEYQFSNYGLTFLKIMETEYHKRTDMLAAVFPRVTHCTFVKSGPSGNLIPFSGICILPANTFHEKIYFFIWYAKKHYAFTKILVGSVPLYVLLMSQDCNFVSGFLGFGISYLQSCHLS